MDKRAGDQKSGICWTVDQKAAILSRNANLLVSAAAGSGKTAVLVERILSLITVDRIPIQNMLIVTFTNAAAGEMRTRLIKALSARMREPDADLTWLRTQLERAGNAYVMTLHAFCNDLVRKHFYRVEVDPAFRVGDLAQLKSLRQSAVDDTLEEAYETLDPSFVNFVEAFAGNRTDQKLVDLLWEVHGFIQSQPEPVKWLIHHTESLGEVKAEDSIWLKSLLASIVEELNGLIESHQEAEVLCLDPSGPENYLPAIQSDLERLAVLRDAIDEGYARGWIVLGQFALDRLKPIRSAQAESVSAELKNGVTGRRELVKKYIERLKKHFFSQHPDMLDTSISRLLPSTRVLASLVKELDLKYRELKREANVLDFYDLEHLAIEILKDPEISEMYREKFAYIFLDEYQDSNLVQETVIQSIARDDNVFLVGDVKQSIYKFRLADPTLFQDKLRRYSREPKATSRIIDLSSNFRTRPELLERINGFFERVMNLSLGEVVYDEHARLNPGSEFPAEDFPALTLTLIDTKTNRDASLNSDSESFSGTVYQDSAAANGSESDEANLFGNEEDDPLVYMKNAELEAHVIADMIRETMKQPIYDPKIAHLRPPAYRDIVILMRSPKGASATYLEVLNEYGIPVRADGSGGKLEAFEMQVFLSLLRLIDNSRLDLDLLSVLRSPAAGFSINDLVRLRKTDAEMNFRDAIDTYLENTLSGIDEETSSEGHDEKSTLIQKNTTKFMDPLAMKLKTFFEQLERWADFATHERLGDFTWRLLIETGLLDYARAMPSGTIRADNLLKLVDRAKEYETTLRGDLGGWIKTLEQSDASDMGVEIPKILGEEENYVRIMSIHKSKGLEFPIVFLADTGKKFNMRDTFGDLLLHKDLGIALKEVDPEARSYRTSLPQLAIQKAIENESLSEELRILYVALTRAVDRLYITGSTRQFDNALTGWQRGCTSFAMRRARSLLDWMASYAVGGEGVGPAKWHWHVVHAADMIRSQNKTADSSRHLEDLLNQAAGMTLPAELLKRLEESKTPELRLLPAKISVTELKALDEFDKRHMDRNATLEALYRPQLNETPKFLCEEDRAALGAARGSAFHIILQNLSLEKMSKASIGAQESIFEEERADLIRNQRIDPERAAEITWPELSGFFNHPMFLRLAASTKIAREKAFVVRRGGGEDFTMIQGIIDLYFEEAEGIVLIDYKTDRLEGPGSTQILKERYSPQLRLYAQALTKLKNMPVTSAWIYASSGGRWIEADLEHYSEERREPI